MNHHINVLCTVRLRVIAVVDDAITNYLSGLPHAWNGVTVRHLLTHTSGIQDYTGATDFLKVTMN